MIPKDQLDAFVLTVSEAFGCGAEGRVPRGYLLLCHGMREAQESASDWSPALEALWKSGLLQFKTRFPTDWYPTDP